MTTLFCVLVFLTIQMAVSVRGQAVAEQRHVGGPAKERDHLDLSSYRQRMSLSDLIGEAKTMDDGLEDDNIRAQIVSESKLLNSVLAQLQKARTDGQVESFSEMAYEASKPFEKQDAELNIFPEYTETLPENWERGTRQLGAPNHFSICNLDRKHVYLTNDEEFEYRPAQYEEIRCVGNEYDTTIRRDVCFKLGFSCFQWNKTIHLTRRRHSSACWEPITRVIPAGCECMWPEHKLGDIKMHM